jgi:predicted phage terminase large subunit-like protein
VDDPLNPLQAASEVMRKSANDWFDQTFSSRLDDKERGVIVVVMQRLHQEDLTGHLLAKGGWENLCIPAVAETRTVIDFGRVKLIREPGDLLHPSREGPGAMERAKRDMGSMAFAGQYQQRPTPAEGGILKLHWFPKYEKPEQDYIQIVQSWDTAYKKGEHNDPSACLTFGARSDGHDLLHVLVSRMEYPELKATLIRHAADWQATAVLVEDKASGQSLLQDVRKETTLPLIAIMPHGDKLTRATTVSAMVEAGRVRLPRHAAWLTDFEGEMMHFPNGAHDDQVDALTQYLDWIRTRAVPNPRIRNL